METNSANSITAWYTPGVCESRWQGGAWQTFYYHADGLGSTRELTDTLQRVTDAYAYNAWGELHGQLRDASDPNKPVNPLRFVGKEGCYTDDSTGLVLMGARYYDPLLGRFITQDADSNPANLIDPDGKRAWDIISAVGGVLCPIFDVADVVVSAAEGDWTGAGLSAIGLVPVAGDIVKAVGKGARVVADARKVRKAAKAAEAGDEIAGIRRVVRNSYGRKGGPLHRSKVDEIAEDIRRRGLKARKEFRIGTPGGGRSKRYVDVAAVHPKNPDLPLEIHQVGRTNRYGYPVGREAEAIHDIRHSWLRGGASIHYHPYDR